MVFLFYFNDFRTADSLKAKYYGGPQVSRQKFQVNTAQLKKIRQQLL